MTAAERVRRWRENPLAMAVEEFKFIPDVWQEKVLRVFPSQDRDKLRISMQACVGPGKTALLAVLNLIFIATQGDRLNHPKGFCVSITEDNLNSSLWPELAVWQSRSEYMKQAFQWTKQRFSSREFPATWFLEARTWSKKADKATLGRTLSGLHAKYVMATLDEAGDIPVPILLSAEQIFSNYEWAKVLMAGNPTSHEGALYHAAVTARHLWYIVEINGDPDDVNCSPRVNIENNVEQIRLYGRDNPWIMATILGKFPPSSINALLDHDEVKAAMSRIIHLEQYDHMQKRIGLDVARFGNDRTCGFPRQGLVAFKPFVMAGQRTTTIAARVATGVDRWSPGDPRSVLVMVDDTGHWGHGVMDNLFTAGFNVHAVIYHAKAVDPRYKNLTTEMHFRGAQWIKNGGALPNDPEFFAELVSRTYTFINGQIALEDKGIAKARLGRSPDKSDAFMNTFALPDMPARLWKRARDTRKESDFDPLENYSNDDRPGRGDSDFDPMRGEM